MLLGVQKNGKEFLGTTVVVRAGGAVVVVSDWECTLVVLADLALRV